MLETGLTRSQKYYSENREKVLARNRVYRENNREKILTRERVKYKRNKDKILKQQKERYYSNIEQSRAIVRKSYHKNKHTESAKRNSKNSDLKRRYKITIEQYEQMKLNQNNQCAICKEKFESLCVDHDHVTNKVRDLLCSVCNQALGMFKENTQILNNAIAYVRKWIR